MSATSQAKWQSLFVSQIGEQKTRAMLRAARRFSKQTAENRRGSMFRSWDAHDARYGREAAAPRKVNRGRLLAVTGAIVLTTAVVGDWLGATTEFGDALLAQRTGGAEGYTKKPARHPLLLHTYGAMNGIPLWLCSKVSSSRPSRTRTIKRNCSTSRISHRAFFGRQSSTNMHVQHPLDAHLRRVGPTQRPTVPSGLLNLPRIARPTICTRSGAASP